MPAPWEKYNTQTSQSAKPWERSSPSKAGFIMPSINAGGMTLKNPQLEAQVSGATSGASTAASEAAKIAAEKKQLQDFISQFVDPNRPLSSIPAEEMLKANNATPELVEKVRKVLGLDATTSTSGEAAKIKEIGESGLRQVDALGKEILGGNKLIGASLPFGIGDRKTAFIKDDLADLIGRLRSGGAINEDEEARFQRLIPGWLDFTQEEKLYKLNELGQKFGGLAKTLKSDKSFVPFKANNQPAGGLAPEKQQRLMELRQKQAEGTLDGTN